MLRTLKRSYVGLKRSVEVIQRMATIRHTEFYVWKFETETKLIIKKWTKIRNFNHMWNRCNNFENFTFIFFEIECELCFNVVL